MGGGGEMHTQCVHVRVHCVSRLHSVDIRSVALWEQCGVRS